MPCRLSQQQSFASVGNVAHPVLHQLSGATVIVFLGGKPRQLGFGADLPHVVCFGSVRATCTAEYRKPARLTPASIRVSNGVRWFVSGSSVVFMAIHLPFANKIISLFVPACASGVNDVARGYLFTVVPFYLVVCNCKFVR